MSDALHHLDADTTSGAELANRAAYIIAIEVGWALGTGQDADAVTQIVNNLASDFETRFPNVAAHHDVRTRATQSCQAYLNARRAADPAQRPERQRAR